MTPRECAYATASHASIRWGRSSRRCRSDSHRANRAFSVSPRTSFWAQKRVPSARRSSSYTATIPGWLSWAVSLASRRKRFQAVLSLGLEWGDSAGARSSFSATSRPTNSSTARRTTDCPPRPSSSRRVYCPSLSAGTVLSSSSAAAPTRVGGPTAVPNVRETAAAPPSDARTSSALPCRAARASFASASSSSRRAGVSAPASSRCVKSERGSLPISRDAAASITCFGVTKPACVASTPTIRSRSCIRRSLCHLPFVASKACYVPVPPFLADADPFSRATREGRARHQVRARTLTATCQESDGTCQILRTERIPFQQWSRESASVGRGVHSVAADPADNLRSALPDHPRYRAQVSTMFPQQHDQLVTMAYFVICQLGLRDLGWCVAESGREVFAFDRSYT